MANEARRIGLDFVAVTDHNTVSHHALLPAAAARTEVVMIPGQEVTTDGGHAACLGPMGWIDWREPVAEWLRAATRAGGLFSINHPTHPDCGWRRPVDFSPPAVEVWHGEWDRRSSEPFEWWLGHGGVPLGGSDFHRPGAGRRRLGRPTTWAELGDDDGGVLGALRAGRVAVSAGPRAPLVVRVESEIVVVDGDGTALASSDGKLRMVRGDMARMGSGSGPHRLVADDGTTLAFAP